MDEKKLKVLSDINIIHDRIRHTIEEDAAFGEHFGFYKNLIHELNDGLIENVDDNRLKESYKNEVSIILIIGQLLKRNLGNKTDNIDIDNLFEQLDEFALFCWHNEKIKNIINFDNVDISILSYEEIIDLFPQKQITEDKKLFGQYYTPNFMVDHVLKMVSLKKTNLIDLKVVDPACGNGAFLIRVMDMLNSFGYSIGEICNYVSTKLFGFDINPSAIFLCKLSIYLKLIQYCDSVNECNYVATNINLDNFKNINTIITTTNEKFNVILGNPPYFKIKNGRVEKNSEYSKVLNGQSNIYALFIQWSILHVEDNGSICLIVPQSFRSGKYFKKIRHEMSKYSLKEILSIDTKTKNQVFGEVEQAILIMHLKNDVPKVRKTKIAISIDGMNVNKIGQFNQSDILSSESLVLPINDCSKELLLRIKTNYQSFQEIEPSITFGNGLFVWNQNKQILSSSCEDSYPIIYANYISDNNFVFNIDKNNIDKDGARRPFCKPNSKLESFECAGRKLIVKRTSGIEDFLRIKSCLISEDFVLQYPKYYLENHVNFLYDKEDKNKAISINKLLYISAYLSSDIANFIFKLMNGNTQVSATELNALPFIYKREKEVVALMKRKSIDLDKINQIFFEIFELSSEEIQTIKNYKAGFSK